MTSPGTHEGAAGAVSAGARHIQGTARAATGSANSPRTSSGAWRRPAACGWLGEGFLPQMVDDEPKIPATRSCRGLHSLLHERHAHRKALDLTTCRSPEAATARSGTCGQCGSPGTRTSPPSPWVSSELPSAATSCGPVRRWWRGACWAQFFMAFHALHPGAAAGSAADDPVAATAPVAGAGASPVWAVALVALHRLSTRSTRCSPPRRCIN